MSIADAPVPSRGGTRYAAAMVEGEKSLRSAIFLAGLIALAGCASPKPAEVVAQPAPANGSATILSMRTVQRNPAATPIRTVLLAESVGSNDTGEALVEFIVRTDDGAVLSIVQTNESGFRNGDRVVIVRDTRTHLTRPG
jgi:hypothetical protein